MGLERKWVSPMVSEALLTTAIFVSRFSSLDRFAWSRCHIEYQYSFISGFLGLQDMKKNRLVRMKSTMLDECE